MKNFFYLLILIQSISSQVFIGGNIDQFLKPENKTINLMYYRILFPIETKKMWIVNSSEQFKTDFTYGTSDYEVLQRNLYQSFTFKIKSKFSIGAFHNVTYATISSISTPQTVVVYDYHYAIGLSCNVYSINLPTGEININTDIGFERNFFDSNLMIYPKFTYIYNNIQIRVFSLYDFKNKISTVAMNFSWKIDVRKWLRKSK